jgi:3-methyladenine DNA glycosylase/8-oxoguanine DNA glycosylase
MSEKRLFEINTEYKKRLNKVFNRLKKLEVIEKNNKEAKKEINEIRDTLLDLSSDLEEFNDEYD